MRISEVTPKSRSRLNARRATAELATSRWTATSPRPRRWTLPAAWNRPDSSASLSQSLRGAIAASSFRRSSERDTFELQEASFVLQAEAAVAAETVGGDDSVAWEDERVAVLRAERTR